MPNFFQRPLRLPKVPHSYEDMSHNFKTTTKIGLLTPLGVEEIVPSDQTRRFSPSAYMRLSPLLYPIMHRVNARLHTFEVPYRIILGDKVYEDWKNKKCDFITVNVTSSFDSLDDWKALPAYDVFTTLGYKRWYYDADHQPNQILYHMENGLDFLSLLVIWREWYADSIIDQVSIAQVDKIIEDYQARYAGGFHYFDIDYSNVPTQLYARLGQDYFTTARPEPQYGDPVNLLPDMYFKADHPLTFPGDPEVDGNDDDPYHAVLSVDGTSLDLNLTIRELWRREQIQRFWDVTNTFGSRTREWLAGHFGVIFPDDRLQIPRLLQTVNQSFNISEVLQTSEGTPDSPLGAYAGKGTLAMRGKSFKRFYVEHAYVITLLSVVPVNGYASGLLRSQLKKSIFDYALPEFNNIGYQEIMKGELFEKTGYDSGTGPDPYLANKDPWAYTMRYSEYRSHPNRCSNGFAEDGVLQDFHLNRIFADVPGLNPNFISANQDQFYRIFADNEADMDAILVDCAIIHEMYRPVSAQPASMHL